MAKLVVHYKPPPFHPDWTDGCYKVFVTDHPRLGCRMIQTSKVLKDYGNGIFETQWVVYHPVDGYLTGPYSLHHEDNSYRQQ